MPTGNLPASGKKLWEEVYDKALAGSCKDAENPKQCAAGSAWKAVKNAGWSKDENGEWHKKALLTEFSLRIERASYDKASNQRRWRAVASDIDDDLYNDNMSLELFSDFLERIERQESPPEQFCSSAWCGGKPYLSISHYSDLDGDGIPGDVDTIFRDGAFLKAKGIFRNNEIGRRSFEAVCADLYSEQRSDADNKVRISIAFLDYKHRHKSNDFVFVRESLDEWCPECIRELITGKSEGKEYLKGLLIHLALTRVPVNERTSMEVERAMTTRIEDAASIIGEDLAEELDEKELERMVGKSQALVIHSDHDEDTPEVIDPVEVPDEPVALADHSDECEEGDEECEKMMKEKEKEKKKAELKSIIMEVLEEKTMTQEAQHPLSDVLQTLKSQYDAVSTLEVPAEEKLQQIQKAYSDVGETIKSLIVGTPESTPVSASGLDMDVLVKALSTVMQPLAQKLDLLNTQLASTQPQMSQFIPQRRSITTPPPAQIVETQSETPKLRALLRKTVQ